MGKKATKAADNRYYLARSEAAEQNPDFSSREKAAEIIGIDRTRLARIELDTITPYPEEVRAMAKAYNIPELCNSYCARECPIGRNTVREVSIDDFDPAFVLADSTLVYPRSYQSCEILDNGPLRFTVDMIFGPLAVGGRHFSNRTSAAYS